MPRLFIRRLVLIVVAALGAAYLLRRYDVLSDRYLGRQPTEDGPYSSPQLSNTSFKRQTAIRDAMKHAWSGYRQHAFGMDELEPISKSYNNKWGNWSISLVDALDTLIIMDMKEEYAEAKAHVRNIDFTKSPEYFQVPMFEMTIRALGGLLGAYELDNDPMLLQKAKDVGDSLAIAFETDTGLPSTHVNLGSKKPGIATTICIAESGTVQLEFKKLSQLTGDDKYRKLAERTSDALEAGARRHEGLYPSFINIASGQYDNSAGISVGAYADSFYEYQLKQYVLDRRETKFRDRYIRSSTAIEAHLVARDTVGGRLFLGSLSGSTSYFVPEMEQLACFYPGLLALGAQTLNRPTDLALAEELAYTCYVSYAMTTTGLGPERFRFAEYTLESDSENTVASDGTHPPPKKQTGSLSGQRENIKKDSKGIIPTNSQYILRPETLESLFILYRVTGDPKYQEWGWNIFLGIEEHTKVEGGGYAALRNVQASKLFRSLEDSMESFFLAETLKYLYLLFSPTDLIALDEYVLNTEAHPLKIIK
ncbi:hypothetical protein EV175_006046 [Coemansia sp. RSA 1933]|nr:hypothetical protein EV175_006046 [Coemansia sp. RSA 1933]